MCSQGLGREEVGPSENGVDDALNGRRRVDTDCVARQTFLRRVLPTCPGLAVACWSAPIVLGSEGKTPVQRFKIDLKDEDLIEQIDEEVEVPGTTAEEGSTVCLVGREGPDLLDVPDPMLEGRGVQGLTGPGIAPIRQVLVTVDGVIAPPLQLLGHRGLASTGNASDEIVLDSQVSLPTRLATVVGWLSRLWWHSRALAIGVP
jgi:hypothetical protein